MKTEIVQNRSMLGRKLDSYTASFAGWQATGKTKDEAETNLVQKISRQNQFIFKQHAIRANGATFMLNYQDGWNYHIVKDDSPNEPGCTCLSCQDFESAKKSMAQHAAQWNQQFSQQIN